MTWTHFHDMHSGGGRKEAYAHIYIEAPEDEARLIFYNRFNHNPDRVSCTCCGEDYSISSEDTLEELTKYYRETRDYNTGGAYQIKKGDWKYRKPKVRSIQPLENYTWLPDVLVIYAGDIADAERTGEIPRQGFVWMGDDE